MSVFWERGFDAATYDALETATGLRRQSLVYAFGDKRAMFLRALDQYSRSRVSEVCDRLRAEPADEAIIAALSMWKDDAKRRARRGCLMVRAAGEVGPADKVVARTIAAARRRLVDAFASAIERAKAAGEINLSMPTKMLAELIVNAGDGALLHAGNERGPGAAIPTLEALEQLLFE